MTEFDIDIDPATNLPKLPEGMVWNVYEETDYRNPYVRVEIVEPSNPWWVTEDKWASLQSKSDRRGPAYDVKLTGNTRTLTKEREVSKRVAGMLWSYNATESYEESQVEVVGARSVCSYLEESRDFEWTPEFLLKVSFEVMERWEADKQQLRKVLEREALKASIIGTYPPKRREETPVDEDPEDVVE